MEIRIHAYSVLDTVHWTATGLSTPGRAPVFLRSGSYPAPDCPTLEDEADYLCQQIADTYGKLYG
jgi:hypothetical protein